ncbi:VOC family protein [Kribbella kalugense]|uniref:Putative glyoxalase superfamily protein PhnB n=1 Tax=Kribbella kalugense TaxID=2512221 RepID=A0A4R7ZYJ3_9ACTN|nr:VOC family protein [Kribbella kalugense]TDW23273.1 putative glyoxalase superfamily protein PhnB [Kribbella kalugense]
MNTTTNVIGVWPGLHYRDGQAALKFLTEGLGFTVIASYAGVTDGSIAHAELAWPTGGGIMMGSADAKAEPDEFTALAERTQSVYLVHDDPDSLIGRAIGAGAVVVRGLEDTDYGSRGFTVRDPEGNLWSVGTYAGEISK